MYDCILFFVIKIKKLIKKVLNVLMYKIDYKKIILLNAKRASDQYV